MFPLTERRHSPKKLDRAQTAAFPVSYESTGVRHNSKDVCYARPCGEQRECVVPLPGIRAVQRSVRSFDQGAQNSTSSSLPLNFVRDPTGDSGSQSGDKDHSSAGSRGRCFLVLLISSEFVRRLFIQVVVGDGGDRKRVILAEEERVAKDLAADEADVDMTASVPARGVVEPHEYPVCHLFRFDRHQPRTLPAQKRGEDVHVGETNETDGAVKCVDSDSSVNPLLVRQPVVVCAGEEETGAQQVEKEKYFVTAVAEGGGKGDEEKHGACGDYSPFEVCLFHHGAVLLLESFL
jgi:hypothetical protein